MKILPEVLKPIIVSEFATPMTEGATVGYSNGYDVVSVTLGEKHEKGYCEYSIITADGERVEAVFTYAELRGYIEEQLYQPIKERYSVEDFQRICQEKGSLHGIVKIKFYNFYGYLYPDYVLLNSLIDISSRGSHGIEIKYEIMGFWGETIYVMIIAKLSTQKQ